MKSWYGGSPNNGIVLKAANESAAARNVYYASNYPDGSVAYPVLSIYYVNNAGLEDYWSCHSQSNWSSPGGTVGVDASAAYLGTKSLKVTQNQTKPVRCGAEQTVTGLVPGYTYTLSAYMKTQGVSGNQGANLYAAAFNGSTQLNTVSGNGLFGDNDWQRATVTFTVPEGTTRVLVYGGLSYANGTAWFDCLQLETGSVANLYNLLENSNFSRNTNYLPDHWSVTNFTSGDGMSSGRVRLGGDANLNKNFFQNVYVNRPANKTAFSVSAKSQGKSVPTQRDGRYYAIDVGTYFTDGTSQWNIVDFNPDAIGEQYTSGTVAPSEANQSKTVSRIEYYIIYYKNANEAFFKDLQLNLDETGTTYDYNDDGKLVTSKQNAKNKGAYDYSSAKELTSATVSNGASSFSENYTYTYASGNAHRLTAARSKQTGIGLAFGYTSTGNVTDTKMGTVSTSGALDTNAPYLQSTQGYTNDNYVTSVTDQRGKETKYNVNLTLGLTNAVTDPKGNTVSYTYDPLSHLTTKVSAPSGAGTVENTYGYDGAGRLNRITHNGFDYTFARDGFGNTTGTNAGERNLITNIFAPGNGNLLSSTYGNGFKVGYGYDSYDRVTSVLKNDAAAYYYTYDARGNLAKVSDVAGSVTTDLSYDVGDRLIRKTASDGGDIRYSYDNMDRTTKTAYTFAGQTKTASASYGADSRKGNTNLLSGGKITYAYDSLNREAATDLNPVVGKDPAFRVQRAYAGVSGNRTTTLVGSYGDYRRVNGVNTVLAGYDYTYDDNGNIATVKDKDQKMTAYAYDQLNQLVRTDDQKAGVSTTYSYDAGGNITEKKTYAYAEGTLGSETGSVSYSYGDPGWKDLLTSYNGQAITSDEIGNPLSYRDGMKFTWEGRELKTASANGKNIRYTYNSDGIRTGKTVDGTDTSYFLDGSTVIAQKTGDDVLWFLYDSDGTRVGFTYNGAAYYYMTNAQGDVTGIVDSNVNSVVEYSYDAWGKLLSTTGSMAGTVGTVNPFLYRGYCYDAETGLYYLNSRYYDPETGRFINADNAIDGVGSIQGYNVYAYCNNNPINTDDSSGHWPQWIKNITNTTIINTVKKIVTAVINVSKHLASCIENIVSFSTPNRRPDNGTPGSTYKAPNGDTRTYGPDGRQKHDYDHDDHGQPEKHPHDKNGGHNHDWDWSKTPPRGKAYIIDRKFADGVNLDIMGAGIADDLLLGSLGVEEELIIIFG